MITAEQLKTLTEIAERAYRAGVCPPDHRSSDTTFAVMLAGTEMGFEPMQSIRLLQVVKGRVNPTADATVGLVARSPVCRYFRCAESTATQAVYETHREGHPEPARLVYTIQQAQRAGLTGSQTWKAHPEAMLRARCAAALARQVYPDLVSGIYSADEIAEIARDDDHAPAAPAPAPAVPAAITAATTCAAVGAAYRGAVDGTDPSDPALATWRDDCLTAAMATLAALGVHLSQADYRRVIASPALAALCDEVLGLASGGRADTLPGWWIQGEAALSTLPGDDRGVLGRLVARLWRRLDGAAPAAHVTAAGRAFVAERESLRTASRTREPGDDDGDDDPPSAPQPPPQGRRTRATGSVSDAAPAPADGPSAWLGDDAAAEAHAASWSHARHVEASVRRHAPTVSGDAYDRLVRVAAARMEALSQPDAYGTRPTAAGLHRTVSRWAAEGPVTQRRAA